MKFRYGSIKIGQVGGAAAIMYGQNFPLDRKDVTKQSEAFGRVTGDSNAFTDSVTVLADEDGIDGGEIRSAATDHWLGERDKDV